MAEETLTRRSLLGIGVCGSLALVEPLLAGCTRQGPTLVAARGELPERWLRQLPRDWQLRLVEAATQVQTMAKAAGGERPALVSLGDGWATSLPTQTWAPFGHGEILDRLDARAASPSRLFGALGQPPLAFPWSANPWVLVLRGRPDLVKRESAGWDLLLDPTLKGKVVLPSSPRVVMSLVGEDPQRLRLLRRQALAQDDRHGLNLLLSGPAEAAVLPRPQVLPLLRRDPRLAVLLPSQGAPMAWSFLLRPAGALIPPPKDWMEALLSPPLLPRVLAAGWVPPVPRSSLQDALQGFSPAEARLLLPPEAVLQRCKDLPPLQPQARQRLQELWDHTAPDEES